VTDDVLFDDPGLRVEPEELTAGQRLRARQAERIRFGCHPLSIGVCIPLHGDAPRTAHANDGGTYPRCGTCRFRLLVGGGARDFPKCTYGADLTDSGRPGPRESHGPATDVRAWWPACVDYAAREAS
jgi:hypothetical protein